MLQQSFVIRFYRIETGGRKRYGPELGPYSRVAVHQDFLRGDEGVLAEVIFNEWKLLAGVYDVETVLAGDSLWAGFEIRGQPLGGPSAN